MQLGKALATGVAADDVAPVEVTKHTETVAPVAETKVPETVA